MASAADLSEAKRQLLARMLSGQGQAAATAPAPIPPRDPAATVPVTAEQSQLWLHAAMAPDMPLYNESITIHRRGSFDLGALERALSEIVRRHEIWRTSFAEENGELVQRIAPPLDLKLQLIDLTHLPEAARDAQAVRLATEDARTAIPFDRAPLFRARVMKLAGDDHRLYLTLHHIIFDGVSIYRTVVPELAKLYEAFAAGLPSPLPEPKLQYGDYAVWQQQRVSDESERQLRYWRERLKAPLPRLEVMGDRPRPAAPTHAGSMEVFELSPALIEALKTLARAEGATLYMVLLAAWKATLFRYTDDEDLIVGGVTDTRRRPELVGLVGYFLNTMALRTRPAAEKPFRDYLAEVRTTVLGALDHCDVPFDRIVRELDIRRAGVGHPLFNTLFSIEPPVDPFPEGWDLTQMDVTVGAAKYDLYMELDERPEGGMAGRLLYGSELYDPATIRRIVGSWQVLLQGLVADPACPLGRLPLLTKGERDAFEAWSRTERPLAFETLPERFAEQAAATPDAIAVECEGASWTYARLDARAGAIAARLEAEGVGPETLVGIALTRSPEMVAALLGVLKAGGAYLPLDPDFPAVRLKLILEDAAPALLLTEQGLLGQLPETDARTLYIDDLKPSPLVGEGWEGGAEPSGSATKTPFGSQTRAGPHPTLPTRGRIFEVVSLRLRSTANRIAARTVGKLLPAQKLLVYRDNLDFFRSLDALVVSERTSLVLKTRYALDLPMILADHGAGDRAIGFNAETARFDLILAAGPKIRDRLVAEAGADPAKIVITGYPKFDLARREPLDLPFLGNGRPTVLYNPHVSPHLSSWYAMGRQVLDYFLASDAYNLIFAPHIMLFERRIAASVDKLRIARPGRLDPKYARAPHIHVDLGSRASTDMSYTDSADIYLGDVSSQIYEFLRRPRPALFLNPHRVEWDGDPNYAHWQAGPVIEDTGQLGAALGAAIADHERLYEPAQRKLFDYTFNLTNEPSGMRAARAIRAFLGLGDAG